MVRQTVVRDPSLVSMSFGEGNALQSQGVRVCLGHRAIPATLMVGN